MAEDRAAATHWYLQGAKCGEAQSQYNLGELFLHGEAVPADELEAFT